MSELINNSNDRLIHLTRFASRLMDGENGKMLMEEYKQLLDTVTAAEAMQVFDSLLLEVNSFEKVKRNTGKIINAFYRSLGALVWNKPTEGHFLYYIMLENRNVEKIMTGIKTIVKEIYHGNHPDETELYKELGRRIQGLEAYELHYIKKENILFPYLEKSFNQYRCLQLMWSFHDDFRNSLKVLQIMLREGKPDKQVLNKELSKLTFVIYPIIFREEQIVFPVALRSIPEKVWDEMMLQSFEIGWCYGITPVKKIDSAIPWGEVPGLINLGTGSLNSEQLRILFESLPVDLTFVDENDEVRHFSESKQRIFPRSKAILGRKVQNCHPPESVHIVNEIIAAFRSGEKEHADFWISMKGRFIYIRYFAMRNEQGEYKGTLEVSQDVTQIRKLKGEQRLLDWGKSNQRVPE